MTVRKEKTLRAARLPLIFAVAAILVGCSEIKSTITPSWGPGQTAGSAQSPRVQDCAIVGISSPTKYACNGKVYTSFQLALLRAQEEKKYSAGH